MKRSRQKGPARAVRSLRVNVIQAVKFLLYTCLMCPVFIVSASEEKEPVYIEPSEIIIIRSDEGYSITAEKVFLTDILHELGNVADFKLKIFEQFNQQQKDWIFHPAPLPRLLDNLLRDFNTVLLYEEKSDGAVDSNNRKLKELWLIARKDGTAHDMQSNINIEIEIEQQDAVISRSQNLTAEQQYEIAFIDNLEGLTGNDVIETLKQTLSDEKDPVVRKRAVTALGEIGGMQVLDALESGMGDSSAEVRAELAKSFANIKDQRSMLLLGQMIVGDHDSKVRQQAVKALFRQNTIAARTFVETASRDKDKSVKKVADELLQQWEINSE